MKTLRSFISLAAIVITCSTARAEEGVADLAIGSPAPDFELIGIDDKMHKLSDFKDDKVLVVFFTSNHCPTSHGAEKRVKKFLADVKGRGVSFVAINPNHPDGLSIDELGYSKYNDGFEDMKKYAAESGFDFPYLYDGDTQTVAKAYGCLATPHVFVFDAERKLRYKGRFDDSHRADESTVKSHDTRNAVEAILAGKPVPLEITSPMGCSTKWRSKKTGHEAKMAQWNNTPVTVAPIDKAGIEALRKGGTENVRLINVWATWCAPCVQEFPELVSVSQRFDMRNFEFISISLDEPTDAAKVKTFLEKNNAGLSERLQKSVKAEGRPSNSYIFSGGSQDDLMKTLDPEWRGGLPHTILQDKDGKIIWRHSNAVTADQVRDAILGHLGNHY